MFDTKLNYLMCTDIAGLAKFDFHDFARKLSNKYVIFPENNQSMIRSSGVGNNKT